jgi:hypothetical protein
MRPVAGFLAAVAMAALPALAMSGDYDPCKNRGTRRIAIVYSRSGGILGDGGCKAAVSPAKKMVCAGDTVSWSVINTCDAEEIADIRLDGLDRVTERCSVVRRLDVGGAQEIRCRLRRGIRDDVKQEYEVSGRIGKGRLIVDPELDIRRPR